MFWIILLSVWGGFLLGVILMAILFLARERSHHSGKETFAEKESSSAQAAAHRSG